MTETNSLTKAILSYLNYSGHVAWRNNTTGVFDPTKKVFRKSNNRKGISDIIGIHKDSGKLIAIEVKIGKDKLSKDQIEFLDAVRKCKGIVIVAKSLDDVTGCDELK